MKLKDKVIIITGGSSGIGAACGREYLAEGASVVLASNQEAEGEALVAELAGEHGNVRFVYGDVSDEASVEALVAEALAAFGRLDGVHCNAGVWGRGTVDTFSEVDWNKIMGVNVKGALWLAKHSVPAMEKSGGGVFLATTSVAAQIGFPAHAVYCASKAALEAIVRCLAVDHAGSVRAVGVSPGTIDTPMLAASCAGWDKPVAELYAEVEQRIPVKRLGQPEDIAKAGAFLLSDDASYINGTILVLDGGTMALPPS